MYIYIRIYIHMYICIYTYIWRLVTWVMSPTNCASKRLVLQAKHNSKRSYARMPSMCGGGPHWWRLHRWCLHPRALRQWAVVVELTHGSVNEVRKKMKVWVGPFLLLFGPIFFCFLHLLFYSHKQQIPLNGNNKSHIYKVPKAHVNTLNVIWSVVIHVRKKLNVVEWERCIPCINKVWEWVLYELHLEELMVNP